MSKQLGFSVYGSRDESSKAITHAIGQTIKAIEFSYTDHKTDNPTSANQLCILLNDGHTLILWDGGQTCCEHRYMNTDDDLQSIVGSTLKEVLISDGPNERDEEDYGDVKETQFLKIKTTKGEITVANYNAHNGYYGGFSLDARLESAK